MNELHHYLDDKVLQMKDDFDILSWWKGQNVKYLNLQCIARDLSSIYVFIVASELSFSTCSGLVSFLRSRFHLKIVKVIEIKIVE